MSLHLYVARMPSSLLRHSQLICKEHGERDEHDRSFKLVDMHHGDGKKGKKEVESELTIGMQLARETDRSE